MDWMHGRIDKADTGLISLVHCMRAAWSSRLDQMAQLRLESGLTHIVCLVDKAKARYLFDSLADLSLDYRISVAQPHHDGSCTRRRCPFSLPSRTHALSPKVELQGREDLISDQIDQRNPGLWLGSLCSNALGLNQMPISISPFAQSIGKFALDSAR